MAKLKIYKCCICHTVLDEYKPYRLVMQIWDGPYGGRYMNKNNYDFCKRCYRVFNQWIIKHKEN